LKGPHPSAQNSSDGHFSRTTTAADACGDTWQRTDAISDNFTCGAYFAEPI
jgi:hypothetical protein